MNTAQERPVGPAWTAHVAVPDAVVALALVALGVFTIVDSRRITVPLSANVVGPRVFPYAVGVALALAGVAVLAGALRGQRAEPEAGEDVDTDARTDWRTLAKVVAAFAVHVALVDDLGWAPAAALLFAGVAWSLGGSWWKSLIVGVVLGVVIQGLFVSGLGISLPTGVLEGVPYLGG